MVPSSKSGSVTLRADCHLRVFIYLVLPERAYGVNSSGGQPALMYPLPY